MIKRLVDAQYASPYALSACVALREKQLPFEVETVDLGAGAQGEAGFRARSLTWRVPTLVHGDFTLTESSAIAEYVDEMFLGPRLYPLDPPGRANLGAAWSIADVDLALMLNRLVMHGDDVPPHLRDYASAQWARPAVQEWAAKPRPALQQA